MRLILADSQPRVRLALRTLLAQQPGLHITAEASETSGLLAALSSSCPDLLLIEWELPGLAAAGGLPALRRQCPGLSVIALSGQPGARRAALAVGADGFISKSDPPDCLLAALECLTRNGRGLLQDQDRHDPGPPDEARPDALATSVCPQPGTPPIGPPALGSRRDR